MNIQQNEPNPLPPSNNSDDMYPFNTEKVVQLRAKQNDKWAVEVNKNYQAYLQEEENKKKLKEENKTSAGIIHLDI